MLNVLLPAILAGFVSAASRKVGDRTIDAVWGHMAKDPKQVEKLPLTITKLVQAALRATGSSLHPDGHFGTDTTNAVKAFQRANDLFPDGVIGPRTLEKLADKLAVITPPNMQE